MPRGRGREGATKGGRGSGRGGARRRRGVTSLMERDTQKLKAKRRGSELDPRQGLALPGQKPEGRAEARGEPLSC